jgi:RNA polymerase sigma-70 factor (ECF subfamily)
MGSADEITDHSLLDGIERRDSDALAALYDRYASRLMGLASRIVADSSEAEEVLQDVFLYVWRSAATYDPARGPVLAWLLVLTRSRAIDRIRSRRAGWRAGLRALDDVPEPHSSEDVEAGSGTREWEALCRAAIAELPPDQHRALELAYFEGLTHQEIAERTGSPLGTVKTRVRLGLWKLRERMQPYRKRTDGS